LWLAQVLRTVSPGFVICITLWQHSIRCFISFCNFIPRNLHNL
jgi:hypothetical protein